MPPGTAVGPYRLLRRLGAGGMGEVWLAQDTRLHRQVALKMVRPADDHDEAARARLMREARAAAALNDPHIATVHDVIEDQGEVVIVFEYLEGETLHERIARERIPPREAVEIATQVAKALAAAHAQGIVHRDLKPGNIIIVAGQHVKVLDFGIARVLVSGTTQVTGGGPPASSVAGFVGTASYAAPEQLVTSAVDERADLYALGVVLFEMISGKRPFVGTDPVQLASSKLAKEAPPLSSTGHLVPLTLERLVSDLLSRDRDQRPASARDVITRLREVYGSPDTNPLTPFRRGRSVVVVAATILALFLSGIGLWRFAPRTATPPSAAAPVVAVLPLTNISGDASRDFVAAGIAESLISRLASLPGVTVLSRAAVAEARAGAKDSVALTKALGATYLVEGSVQESGGTLRVSLNLVKDDRSVAWGESIEGTFERIFELQSRLASALTSALVVRVSASERERMNAQPTTVPDALEGYWRGKALLERADVSGNVEASITAFTQASRLDPNFALAHAGLGQAYRRKYIDTRDPAWAERAIEEATSALRLDPEHAEVRYVLALTLAGGGRLAEATAELNRALALQPNYEDARRQLGTVLAEQGQIDEAVVEFKKAIALRPTAIATYSDLGKALVAAARYEEAVAVFTDAIAVVPDNALTYQQLGTAYQYLGREEDALESYRKSMEIRPSAQAYSNIGAILHGKGDFAGAVDAYQHAIELRPNSAATRRNLGDALLRLGKPQEAKAAYLEAVRLGEADLKVNPSDARTLAAQAVYLQKSGQGQAASERLADALARAPESADILYRAAVIHALAGDTERSLDFLESAVQKRYSRETARSDDDLISLRQTTRFKQLFKE